MLAYKKDDVSFEELSSLPQTEKTAINSLFDRDQSLRRAQTVVDWLEANARDDMADIVNVYGDCLLGWENTHHSLLADAGHSLLVTELDPDAKTRTSRPLHDFDEKDEQRLIRY